MTKTFIIQTMTTEDYRIYMTGGNTYTINQIRVQAEDAAEAMTIAAMQNGEDYLLNAIAEDDVEAYEAFRKAEAAKVAIREAEKAAARETAQARKAERDAAQGITPEMRKAMTYVKRYDNEIAKLEKELNELKAKRAYWNEKAQG